jgi:hypothetical protein
MVFNWRDTVAVNVNKFAANAAKTQAYGIRAHTNLKAVVILANIEWAARQSWGTEISVAHCSIKAKYRYNHSHDTNSIKEILKMLTGADKARDHCKATAPGETTEMVSQGMESLCQLVQRQPSLSSDSSDTESAFGMTDSEDSDWSRGRSKGLCKMDKKTPQKSSSLSTSRPPHPTTYKGMKQQPTSKEEQRGEQDRRGKRTQSRGLQILCQTRRQLIRAHSAKEHPPRQMQLQSQVQSMVAKKTKVGVQKVGNHVQRLGQI